MKLLIVEDQAKTGQYLAQGLSEAGFNTELAGDDALRMQKLLDAIESLDDVQAVYSSAAMDEE